MFISPLVSILESAMVVQLWQEFCNKHQVIESCVPLFDTAWESGSIGAWKEFGEAHLAQLEYQLMAIAVKQFPNDLLNEEGVPHRK